MPTNTSAGAEVGEAGAAVPTDSMVLGVAGPAGEASGGRKDWMNCTMRWAAFPLSGFGHQGHAHALGAGLAPGFAGQVTAGQHGHIVLSQQLAGEVGTAHAQVLGHPGPRGKNPRQARTRHHALQQRRDQISRYWARLSMTCCSSFQAAMLAACTVTVYGTAVVGAW